MSQEKLQTMIMQTFFLRGGGGGGGGKRGVLWDLGKERIEGITSPTGFY